MKMKTSLPKLLLVDSDSLLFKAGFVNEKKDGDVRVASPPAFAFKTCKDLLQKWLKQTKCTDFRLVMDTKTEPNFRYEVAKTLPYKGNRKNTNRPLLEKIIYEWLKSTYKDKILWVTGMEVDDGLGINQDKINFTTCICSNDKDLDMIPGWHYDPDVGVNRRTKYGTVVQLKAYKGNKMYFVQDPGFIALREVTNKKKILVGAGYYWFLAQMLKGDKVDNIPGLPGYGDVKTFMALKEMEDVDEGKRIVKALYHKELKDKLTKEEINAMIREIKTLLWIRRE